MASTKKDRRLFSRRTFEVLESRRVLSASTSPVVNISALVSNRLAGDYTSDGQVNASDYVVWRRSLGQTGMSLPADGDQNGSVGAEDYAVWRMCFGQSDVTTVEGMTLHSGDYVPPIANNPTHIFDTLWGSTDASSRVVIPQGTTVVLSKPASVDELRIEGTLIFDPKSSVKLTATTILVGETGKLIIRPTDAVNHTIVFRDKPIDLTTDLEQITHGMIALGAVDVAGQAKTAQVNLAHELAAGATQITLASVPTNWHVGDVLILPDTGNFDSLSGFPQIERVPIAALNGVTVTLQAPLKYAHTGIVDYQGKLAALPPIANLTRNVRFQSENPNGVRGHLIFAGDSAVSLLNAEFDDLGRTRAADFLDSTVRNGTTVLHVGTNQIGRYVLHFHHTMKPAVVSGSVINGSPKWGIALHDTADNVLDNNVIVGAVGAGIVTEDGNELNNHISNNYILGSVGSGGTLTSRGGLTPKMIGDGTPANPFRSSSDLGHEGSGIWMHGQANYVVNNTILNVAQFGIVTWTRVATDLKFPQIGTANPRDFVFPEFSGNTIWYSRVGMLFDGVAPPDEVTIKNTSIFGVDGHGVDISYSGKFNFSGLTVIGRNHANVYGIMHQFLEHLTGRNWNIQNMANGALLRTSFDISDSFFANSNVNLLNENSNAASDWIRSTIVNVTFAKAKTNIANYWDPVTAFVSHIEPRELFVYGYNGVVGDDFQILMREQAADYMLPSSGMSDSANALLHTILTKGGSVTVANGTRLAPAQLTNGQLFDTYGVALAGRVAPADAKTRADIVGLIIPIRDDKLAPTIAEQSIRVDYLSPTSVVVRWETNEPSTSTVEYDHDKLTDTRYGLFTKADLKLTTSHAVTISNLSPNTLYAFRPYSADASGNISTIRGVLLGSASGLQRTLPIFQTGQVLAVQHLMGTDITSSSATVQWFSTLGVESSLEVYEVNTSNRSQTAIETAPLFSHEVELTGLKPGTSYGVRVLTKNPTGQLQPISGWKYFTTEKLPVQIAMRALPSLSAVENSAPIKSIIAKLPIENRLPPQQPAQPTPSSSLRAALVDAAHTTGVLAWHDSQYNPEPDFQASTPFDDPGFQGNDRQWHLRSPLLSGALS